MKSDKKEQRKKKITEITTFPVPIGLGEIKENITITTNTSKEKGVFSYINCST